MNHSYTGFEPVKPSIDSADSMTIDPNVTFNGSGSFTITGHVSMAGGVSSVDVSGWLDGQNQDLGLATVNADNSFSFTSTVGTHLKTFVFTANSNSGGSVSADSDFGLQAGNTGNPYVAMQSFKDPTTDAFTHETYFDREGSTVYNGTSTTNSDGTVAHTYSGGYFFDDKPYSSYTDLYSADGTLTSKIWDRNDGSHVVQPMGPGQTVTSNSHDLFQNADQRHTQFVFTTGYGQDVIRGFVADGRGHDTISLPQSDFTGIADVLRHTENTAGGAVIHDPTSGDSIWIQGVTKGDLIQHKHDFTFHA